MHHPTDRIAHTTAFVTPVVKHWLEREIAQWVHPIKDRSDDRSHHERTLLPRIYISLFSRCSQLVRCSFTHQIIFQNNLQPIRHPQATLPTNLYPRGRILLEYKKRSDVIALFSVGERSESGMASVLFIHTRTFVYYVINID